MVNKKTYKHIVYNRRSGDILVRFVGSDKFEKIEFENFCYIEDKSKQSDIKDIHGVPMVRMSPMPSSEFLKNLKSNGISVAESDLNPVVKWSQEYYGNQDLNSSVNDFRIGIFDIEVAVGYRYQKDHSIRVRDNSGNFRSVTLEQLFTVKNYKEINVYDELSQSEVKFKNSCYAETSIFPKPELAEFPINLITFYDTFEKETYTWGFNLEVSEDDIIKNYKNFSSEIEMLEDWLNWFNKRNFDIITGWNSVLFDLPYIVNRIRNIVEESRVETFLKKLSPLGSLPFKRSIVDKKTKILLGESYDITGLVHLDYMDLYKSFAPHEPLPSYSLQYVSQYVLGEGKLEYEGTLNTLWRKDPLTFVQYNVIDVVRLVEIEQKTQIFPLVIEYAHESLVTMDRVYYKVPTTEGVILKYIHENNMVMNDRISDDDFDWWREEGFYKVTKDNGEIYYQNCNWEDGEFEFKNFGVKAGYCYDYAGRFDDCLSFDITSSYPHHIMQFNISPEVKVKKPTKEMVESGEVILSDVNGVGFKNTSTAILPNIVEKIFEERKYWRTKAKKALAEGDMENFLIYNNKQNSKKLRSNSVFGVCLTKSFHLYDIDCARAITRCARVTLRDYLMFYSNSYYKTFGFLNSVAKKYNLSIPEDTPPIEIKNRDEMTVHADTDSLYVCVHEVKEFLKSKGVSIETEDEHRLFYKNTEEVLQNFFNRVLELRAQHSGVVRNRINFSRENVFTNMFCVAKKLYFGNVVDSEGMVFPFSKPKHKIMGVPIKRSDMPDFCKVRAEELAFDICAGQNYSDSRDYVIETFRLFEEAGVDAVSGAKSISEYTKYIKNPIEHYVKNGLYFEKGQTFNAKCSLAWNYLIAKHDLPYEPIENGNRFNYIYIKPQNLYNLEAVAFVGQYPKEFEEMFEVDYEVMFRKTFVPLFEKIFLISGWIGEKEKLDILSGGLEDFFK